jgi:hypothetical protein
MFILYVPFVHEMGFKYKTSWSDFPKMIEIIEGYFCCFCVANDE